MKPVDLQNHSTRLAGRLGGHLLQPCTKSQSQSHQGCPRLKTTRCFHQQRSLSKPAFRVSLKSSIRPPRLPNKEIIRCHSTANASLDHAPEHPAALNLIYVMYGTSCLIERAWKFAVPLMLSSMAGGFRLVAALGFVAPLAVALVGPLVGQTLDGIPRSAGLRVSIIGQSCLIIAGGLIMTALMRQTAAVSLRSTPLFWMLLVVVMIERLTSAATEVSVERDCIPEFSGRVRQTALANSNMKLRRLDLASELIGTIGFSWTLAAFGPFRTLLGFVTVACIALPFQLMTIRQVSALLPDQMNRMRLSAPVSQPSAPPHATLSHVPTTASRLRFLSRPTDSTQSMDLTIDGRQTPTPSERRAQEAHSRAVGRSLPSGNGKSQQQGAHPAQGAVTTSQQESSRRADAATDAGSSFQHARGGSPSQHQQGDASTSGSTSASTSDSWRAGLQPQDGESAGDAQQHRNPPEGGGQSSSAATGGTSSSNLQSAVWGAVTAAQRLPRVWRAYFSQPVLPASLALIMLYFNAVLSPGGLMTAFLSSLGLPGIAAPFRGACAIMGFVGTAVGRTAIARLGLLRAGMLATSLQSALLFGAWLVHRKFLMGGKIHLAGSTGILSASLLDVPICIWLFCGLVVLSRIAFWTFDMVDTQILQTAVNAKEAASISSTEVSLCCFSEVIMLGIAISADDPSTFNKLVTLSAGAVSAAAVLFISWVLLSNAREVMNKALQNGSELAPVAA